MGCLGKWALVDVPGNCGVQLSLFSSQQSAALSFLLTREDVAASLHAEKFA